MPSADTHAARSDAETPARVTVQTLPAGKPSDSDPQSDVAKYGYTDFHHLVSDLTYPT